MPKFHCPHCDAQISADPDQTGESTRCPACGSPIVVPAPSVADGEVHLTSSSPPPLPRATAAPPLPTESGQVLAVPSWLPEIVVRNAILREGIAKANQTALRPRHLVLGVATLMAFLIVVCAIAFRPASKAGPWQGSMSAASRFDDQVTRIQREYNSHVGETCRICGGAGLKPEYDQCSTCRGAGTVRTPSGYVMACSDCSGSGLRRYRCTACNGTGKVPPLR